MKIIKTAGEVIEQRHKREEANLGCHVCPFCQESMSSGDALRNGLGLRRGISSGITASRLVKTGLFSFDYKTVDIFSCNRCGAEWEGNPY